MKLNKIFYLMAMVCTLGFTACGDDDDAPKDDPIQSPIVGTWNVWSQGNDYDGYTGSVQLNWEVEEGTSISLDLLGTGTPTEIPIKETVVPLANSLGNKFLPKVLKSVTFTPDGKINAVVSDYDDDDIAPEWETVKGYATYKVISDNLISVSIDAEKATEDIDDPAEKAQIKTILKSYGTIPVNVRWNGEKPFFFVDKAYPVNVRWNGEKPFFFVDKAYVQPMIAALVAFIDKVPTNAMEPDDLQTFTMVKGVVKQLSGIMDKTSKFEAGIELTK